MYACRNCPFRTEAENPLVFRNDLKLISKVSHAPSELTHAGATWCH